MKFLLRSIPLLLAVTATALVTSAAAAPAAGSAQKHGYSGGARHAAPGHRHHPRPHYSPARHGFRGGYWGPSVGLFYSTLPFGYARGWYGGVPYYYADDVYYMGAPGGYRVIAPPYGEGALVPTPSVAPQPSFVSPTDALVITPQRGQTASQQSFDRIGCERAAIRTTGFDPAAGAGAALARADYVKAVAACLAGLGYSVK